jgi:hypothetical protein
MLTASVVTLLFYANPLVRFDGYYILADGLSLPNLAAHGQQWLIHFSKRWLLWVKSTLPTWPEGRTWLVAAYGVTSAIWRAVVSISLIVAAAVWFEGAGIVLAAGAVLAWFLSPLWRGLRYVLVGSYVASGRELPVIGNDEEKEVRVLISAQQFVAAALSLDHAVRVRFTEDGLTASGTLHKPCPLDRSATGCWNGTSVG